MVIMTVSPYMIGVDIGTTSTKAVLFKQDGSIVAQGSADYPLHTPTPVIAEQDAEDIFQAVIVSVQQATSKAGVQPNDILFVSFSSAMHSILPVDAHGKPLMRAMTWADNRSAEWTEALKSQMNGHDIYLRTGTPIHPMSPLTKIMWLTREQPDLFRQTHKLISMKEYVFYKLFSEFVIDHSMASATGLMNLENSNGIQKHCMLPESHQNICPALFRRPMYSKRASPRACQSYGHCGEHPICDWSK